MKLEPARYVRPFRLTLEPLEGRALPAFFVAGAGAGTPPQVTVFDPAVDQPVGAFAAYDPGFRGGVRAALGEVDGDGSPDVITGPGPGAPPTVKVFDARSGSLKTSFDAFEPSYAGGVYVAAGDFDRDGLDDIVVSPDEGGGPRVKVVSGRDGSVIADFFGIDDPDFRGGVRVALGDVDADGQADLIVAAGFGGGPRVAVFDGRTGGGGQTPARLRPDFFAFEPALRNGAYAAAGDLNRDGAADLVFGGGPGGAPRVYAASGRDLLAGAPADLFSFFAGDSADRQGVRVATTASADLAGADILAGSAGGGVTLYRGTDGAVLREARPAGAGHAFVAGAAIAPRRTPTLLVLRSQELPGAELALSLTAEVQAVDAGANTPTGSVTFYDGDVELGTAPVEGGARTATLRTGRLAEGQHSIRAVYAGDTRFQSSDRSPTQVLAFAVTRGGSTASGFGRSAVSRIGNVLGDVQNYLEEKTGVNLTPVVERLTGAARSFAEQVQRDAAQLVTIDSNQAAVRARIASSGWTPVYGTLIDDGEYVKLGAATAASVISGSPALLLQYFGDLIQRNVDRMLDALPGVARSALVDLFKRVIAGDGKVSERIGNFEVKGGIAAYQRSGSVLGSGAVALPSHYQAYVAFRFYVPGTATRIEPDGTTFTPPVVSGLQPKQGRTLYYAVVENDEPVSKLVRVYLGRDYGFREFHLAPYEVKAIAIVPLTFIGTRPADPPTFEIEVILPSGIAISEGSVSVSREGGVRVPPPRLLLERVVTADSVYETVQRAAPGTTFFNPFGSIPQSLKLELLPLDPRTNVDYYYSNLFVATHMLS